MQIRFTFLFALLIGFSFACKKRAIGSQQNVEQETSSNTEEKMQMEGNDASSQLPAEGAMFLKKTTKELGEEVFARLQRTSCFGSCPVYTLTVYDNGVVEYYGKHNVDKIGLYRATVKKEVLEQLKNEAESIAYFDLKEVYDNRSVTDVPSTITSLQYMEGFKIVVNRFDGPEQLSVFEKYFDSLFLNLDWTAVDSSKNDSEE
jgi:hypothetical protein